MPPLKVTPHQGEEEGVAEVVPAEAEEADQCVEAEEVAIGVVAEEPLMAEDLPEVEVVAVAALEVTVEVSAEVIIATLWSAVNPKGVAA